MTRRSVRYATLAGLGAALLLAGVLAVPASADTNEGNNTHPGAVADMDDARTTPLIPVARFDNGFKLVGIGVSDTPRLFASAPASGGRNAGPDATGIAAASVVEVDPETGDMHAYPNASWNHYDAKAPGDHQWIAVQALWVDRDNHLWALDKSAAKAPKNQPPKLVEFDLATDTLERIYPFGPKLLQAGDSLNDVRIDEKHQVAYISNAKNGGGIAVLDLKSGAARMVLRGDRSSVADPDQHLMFGDEIALTNAGKPLELDTDGIALSPDRDWLYYRPLSDRHYYRIPTAALRDPTLTEAQRAARVQYLGDYALSGGILMGDDGVLYVGDLEHHSVVALTPVIDDDGHPRLQSRVLVHDPDRLAWADGFGMAHHTLYVADSHLNETHFKNGGARSGPFTIFRIPLDTP